MSRRALGKSRIVLAPEPELMAEQGAPNRVLSVKLKPGEEVEWPRHPHGALARMAPGRRSIPN